ncbi:hypothetical protein AVEN_70204-1 [Araneus ventricosus]|uniref:Uncharacterized protein n=1 Tax=Araneus ventricosus TaxID=182803 RepID=A0A4Y2FBX1_ARAVE|nr:hypothetical protein AVEN_70204-1 [Araneus ventricosus]
MPIGIARSEKQCSAVGKGEGREQFMDSHRHSTLFQFEQRKEHSPPPPPEGIGCESTEVCRPISKTMETLFCIGMRCSFIVFIIRNGVVFLFVFACVENHRGSLQRDRGHRA